MDDAVRNWMQEAPALFNKYNQIDEKRLECLQNSFRKYVELEMADNRVQAEQYGKTMNSIQQFDIQAEIDTFCSNKPLDFGRIVRVLKVCMLVTYSLPYRISDQKAIQDRDQRNLILKFIGLLLLRAQSNTFNYEEPVTIASLMDVPIATFLFTPPYLQSIDITSNPFTESGAMPVTDSEGFSVPPADSTPWAQVAEENDAAVEDAHEAGGAKMKIDISDRVITEEPAEASKALTRVSSTLRLKNTIRRSTIRGRRDTRSKPGSLDQLNGAHAVPGSTITASSLEAHLESLGGIMNGPADGNETFRYRESRHDTLARRDSVMPRLSMFPSNPSLSSGNSEHTGISEAGELNGFISEVVNVLFSDGQISKVFITGEIVFSGNAPIPSNSLRMTIGNAKCFERLIPNQALISSIDEENGVYELNVGALSQTSHSKATVFKYQLRVNEAQKLQYVPILLNSVWKCEETLTSLVVTYQANPECVLKGTLSETSFVLPVDDGVTNIQSKPLGIWNAEKHRLLWQAEDIEPASNEPHKLLARFETKAQGHPASVAAKFTHKGGILSPMHLEIPEGPINLHYKLTSGKYIAAPGQAPQ
ncbi:hypothetical protein K493DRAFT_306480 [Basidiobolus meristosporus CBS 931.73]|uniref:MHD domain-containing protein n=1 Tax=Basidiobolus meristosporus CBS 931.73 TaxID=1314790 RepID=A0A1Y1XTJ0_9FUNG|nr:hypothetical protein K493DRAFT_306480 [Basidiobolus meristosporus CBS 931.73]|eukprot:ORX88614.1 hypothetical protein K493DRAFT_306480 [Basidiobolus meristosporus CBS 931.73]